MKRNPNTKCKRCGKQIYRRPSEITKWKESLCVDCRNKNMSNIANYRNRKAYIKFIERWKDNKEAGLRGKYSISNYIRRYLFEKYDNECSICGWEKINNYTKKIPLEVDHIDGDYMNNKEENLRLLCPNCHSLTETYKGANMGNGRKNRSVS